MRFPLRLTADLTLGLVARAIRLKRNPPLIATLVADENFSSAAAGLDLEGRPQSPIVWIAGSDPLDHPEVARVSNSLVGSGRHVFLQTDGALLRRRIHEFKPSSCLHLTIRFDGTQPSHDLRAGRGGSFQAALEGIRVAKLSGFLICAQLILHPGSDAVELTMLHDELRKLDLDGFLISPATSSRELQTAMAAARSRLLSRRWALLSRLLDSVALPAPAHKSLHVPRSSVAKLTQASCEEGAQAP